jgi:hypothetical protein
MAEDLIKEADQVIEEIIEFPVKPGGVIDRHRQEKARREAAQREREQAEEREEEQSYKAVKTIVLAPEIISAQTVPIPIGGQAQIAPAMPYRYAVTVMLVPITGQTPTIVLAKDAGQALSGIGFTLSAGVPVRFTTRAQMYAFNPSAQAVQVSVLAEIYAPEE